MPTVVNRHHFKYEQDIGPPPKKKPTKGQNYLPAPWVYVGRGSPLGNPYRPSAASHHGEARTHEDCLALYRRWLFEKIRGNDRRVLLAMRSIEASTSLVCSCAPRPCHADIVARAWQWMKDSGLL